MRQSSSSTFSLSKGPAVCRAFALLLLIIIGRQVEAASENVLSVKNAAGEPALFLQKRILIRYREGEGREAGRVAIKRFGVTRVSSIDKIRVRVLSVPEGRSAEALMEELQKDPLIESVEMDGVIRAFEAPNDPDYTTQYYLIPGSTGTINAEDAWSIITGNPNIVLAVIDTGVLLTHSDLSASLWVNPNPSGNSGLHGTRTEINWDGDSSCTETDIDLGPEQCASSDPTDNNADTYHGTRVAGIMAATTNNGVNMAGIGRGCRIMAIKVLNSDGFGTFSSIAQGIIYAADNGASVINLSLGGSSGSSTLSAAVEYALNKNVVLVAASGNTSSPPCAVNFPAAISRVIAVGATDRNDVIASFSCTGTAMDLVAPGVNILSTRLGGTDSNVSGTSFASPLVAGVAGLLRSIDPAMSVEDVTRYIDFYAKDLGAAGFDTTYGFGRLDAFKSVQAANNGSPFISNPASAGETFPYPNPYNPMLGRVVTIALPQNLGSEGIEIVIRTLSGEEVKKISGTNTWDGRNEDGDFVTSGLYLYRAKTSKGDITGKITVLK